MGFVFKGPITHKCVKLVQVLILAFLPHPTPSPARPQTAGSPILQIQFLGSLENCHWTAIGGEVVKIRTTASYMCLYALKRTPNMSCLSVE